MNLHIVILAAGQGKRMRSARAKVLLPLAGRPLLDHVLATARALSPAAIHLVHGHRGEQLRAYLAHASDLIWVEQAEQRGTGHAVGLALVGIPDDARVLVLLGDVPLIEAATLRELLDLPGPLALLGVSLDDPSGYGRVLLDPHGRVHAIVEHKDADADQRRVRLVNTGVICGAAAALKRWTARLKPDNAQGELYLTDIFAFARDDAQPAAVLDLADPIAAAGVNDPLQLAELGRHYEQRAVRRLQLDHGVRLARPDLCFVRGDVMAGSDVELDVQVILEGRVVLGDGVRVGAFTRLRNCTLAAGTEVLSHCDLDGVVTTGPCRIGPFARLRPGTELAAGAHVGNFVETKQVTLGSHSKANHLTYLGDATIGSGVNIGAGTITCNYDGVHKHRTTIGDGAFIGSNAALVAPVTIGADATIGAGSVISKDAPERALTVSRARQTTIPGWKRPAK